MANFKNLNRFATNLVKMDMRRSKFNLSHEVKTTFISGKLIPLMVKPVLPDDTWKLSLASVVRSITPAVPVMDNAYLDVFAFWVPNRIACVHEKDWAKIHGENVNGQWAPSTESTLDNTGNTFTISSSSYAVQVQSLAQYIGYPINFYHTTGKFSRLEFNGYWEIYNEWFRDQNTQSAIDWKSYTNSNFIQAIYQTNTSLVDVNKFHDYFTSVLPAPQKGASVLLPLGTAAPVILGSEHTTGSTSNYMLMRTAAGGVPTSGYNLYIANSGRVQASGSPSSSGTATAVYPSNLWADLSNATAANVNQLREAFAIQKLLEKDARGGTRYREMLKAHFNVSIPDNTVQVPEYLGGKSIPLNMLQTLQTAPIYDSQGNLTSPVGSTGAFSNTSDNSFLFTKSFTEYGNIFVLCCIRTAQSYSQGIPREFMRNRRYDWYYPVFANLGEMGVKQTELYATNASTFGTGETIFGYQEAWADLRFIPNKVSGYLAANSGDSAAQSWTYSNKFTAAPVLNSTFLKQDRSNVDNTLVVQNATYQFIGDFYLDIKAWRPMPYFSIPGLIDHH